MARLACYMTDSTCNHLQFFVKYDLWDHNWVDVSLGQGLVDRVIEMCCQVCVASFPYQLQSWLKFHTGRLGRDPQGHVPARPGLNTYWTGSSRYSTGNNDRSLVTAIGHQERCVSQEKYGLPCADFRENSPTLNTKCAERFYRISTKIWQ